MVSTFKADVKIQLFLQKIASITRFDKIAKGNCKLNNKISQQGKLMQSNFSVFQFAKAFNNLKIFNLMQLQDAARKHIFNILAIFLKGKIACLLIV